jgi:PAS domain S-box-containing protein
MQTGAPAWLTAIDADANFPRAAQLLRLGMYSAFGFPITSHGRTTGVMEFFSRESREPDQALMPIMTLIGAQIGDYFERRRTSEALRVSEEQYRVISETAQDAIFTIDRDSKVLFVNKSVERMFGYKPEEIVGKPLETIIPERLREAHRRGIERYLRTRSRHISWNGVELPALHRDGHEFPVELTFGEFHDDEGTIFSGFARDITERHRARTELQNSLEQEQAARAEAERARKQLERRTDEEVSFRHLASALSGAVEMDDVLHEITSRATLVTRADGVYVERIIGNDREVEVVSAYGRGTPARGTRVAYPGSLTEEILKRGAPVVVADMSGFGKMMAPYLAERCGDCEVLVTPLIADEVSLGALVLLNSRSSGRHFGEEEISRAETLGDLASLALRRVRLMEDEREAKEKAEAAVRVRDETLGIVSHDLRNPLTTIALSAEMLADAPPAEQREHVDTIRTAARTMQRLIQDLLDVARVETGGLSIQKTTLDPADLIRIACDAQAPIAETKRIRLASEIGEMPPINADRDRLLQVFGNLIGNALKFTPPGGTITLRGFAKNESVVFQVHDTGPGIPESDLKQVFRPYWQAKKTAHMGAGLGLAIVRGIMNAHGGTATAENGPGGGALFTLTMPALPSS